MIGNIAQAARWFGSLLSLKGALSLLCLMSSASALAQPHSIVVGTNGIEAPLTAKPGQVEAGRAVFADRQTGHCLLCHVVDSIDEPFQGNVGPNLSKGSVLTEAQLRLRLVDSTQVNPNTVMPAYFRVHGLNQVANDYRGKPVLSAQQIEDLIAYLLSLRKDENLE